MATKNSLAALLEKLKGVRLQSREQRLVQLSAKLDEVIEFRTPLDDFTDAHRALLQKRKQDVREAKSKYKDAKKGYADTEIGVHPDLEPLQQKLHKESYVRRGLGIGAGTGAGLGSIIGAGISGSRGGGKATAAIGAGLGLIEGGIIGGGIGTSIGARIRRKQKIQ